VCRAVAFLAVAVLVAGCGGGSGEYAGLNRTEALQQADEAAASVARDPSDPLYGHRLRLLGLTRGHDLAGKQAWLGRYEDAGTGRRLCVWVSSRVIASETSVRPCTPRPAPPPPPPPAA
jgi:hypothetical protein